MNLWLWIARSVAAAILGLLIFTSFLSFLLVSNFSGKVLDVGTYTAILNEHDAYNRLYDEVLLEPQIRRITSDLIGDIQLVGQPEIVQIVRQIVPPDYLQVEVEKNLASGIEYLNGERDALELEIDLREPLADVEANVFEHIDRRIDELDIVDIDAAQEPLDQLAEVEELINAIVWDIATGKIPEAIPAIGFIPEPLRANVFDSVLPSILNDPRIDRRVSHGLRANVTTIRSEFIAGDTRRFLKEVAHAGLTPLVDQGIGQVSRYADDQGRLNLIAIAADNSDGVNEETLRRDIDGIRAQFRRVVTIAGDVALIVAIVGTVVMFLIYLPSLINAMRWPGLTLMLTGLVLFVLGKIMENTLPRLINALVEEQIVRVSELPPSAVTLVNDLVQSLTDQLFSGLANPAVIILLVGALLFGGSFLVHLLRPVAPWIR